MSIHWGVSEREHPQKCHFLYFLERPLQQFCTTVQTVIGRGDYVRDIYPCGKLHFDPIRGFCPPHMPSCLPNVHSASFFLILVLVPTRYRLGRCADFDDQYVKRRRFAQGCAFLGSREQIFTCWPHFRPKRKFLVDFRRDFGTFGSKRALTWGALSVNTP